MEARPASAAAAIPALIRQAMPGVARLVHEKRRLWGDAHVTDCQRKGMAGEPGHFFCREGAISVGTPWADDDVIAQYVAGQLPPGSAFLCMRPPAGQPAGPGAAS